MKILITGIPGTGKTSMGNYLALKKGFEHFDVEAILKKHGKAGWDLVQEFLSSPGDKKVMTWGFLPVYDDAGVFELQNHGFKMFWFDGDRVAARREFLRREFLKIGDDPVQALDNQMAKIEKFDLEKFKPIHINTFSENGTFLEKEAIAELIMEKCR